jgi:hypothetical protein
MLEKLKMIEEIARDFKELTEFKQALLAYEMGIRSDEITINQADAIADAINDYYDRDEICYFIDERIVDEYEVSVAYRNGEE